MSLKKINTSTALGFVKLFKIFFFSHDNKSNIYMFKACYLKVNSLGFFAFCKWLNKWYRKKAGKEEEDKI